VASCIAPEGERADGRYFTRPCVTDHRMAATFARLSSNLLATPAESLRAETLLRAFLGTMLARHGERPGASAMRTDAFAADARMAQVRDYIRMYFQRDLTVADLAAVAGMSRAHLMPLAAVAIECGFADQSHLTRRFKGCVGVTPSGWRDRLRR